jgi:hypothetical protein
MVERWGDIRSIIVWDHDVIFPDHEVLRRL